MESEDYLINGALAISGPDPPLIGGAMGPAAFVASLFLRFFLHDRCCI